MTLSQSDFNAAITDWFSYGRTEENPGPYGAISTWDTSLVTDMSSKFRNQTYFTEDISGWVTSKVTNMSSMFEGAVYFNRPLSTKGGGVWDVSKVTNMSFMFAKGSSSAHRFNSDISNWDTSKVKHLTRMFFFAKSFNQDISKKWVTNVGNKPYMAWDTSNVENMTFMLRECLTFNQPIGNWNTSSLTQLIGTFFGARSFNKELHEWDVSKVSNAKNCFRVTPAFTKNLGRWKISPSCNISNFFLASSSPNVNDTPPLSYFNQAAPTPSVEGFTGSGGAARATSLQNEMNAASDGATAPSAARTALTATITAATATGTAAEKKTKKRKARSAAIDLMFSGAPASVSTFKLTAAELGLDLPDGADTSEEFLTVKPGGDITIAEDPTDNPRVYVAMKSGVSTKVNLSAGGNSYDVTFTMQELNNEEQIFVTCTPAVDLYISDDNLGTLTGDSAGGGASYLTGYLLPGDIINIVNRQFQIGSLVITHNSDAICFLGSEKVRTDQGLIRFDKLTLKNTINRYKIKKITKTLNPDNHMIYIHKSAINNNVPDKPTYISRNHGIIINNHIVKAKTLENGSSIIQAFRDPDIIYNVLTEKQTIMLVNNMPCETLNLYDPIIKKYT